ncbi:hypothetical protein [Bradyrhizobium sp.]|uniref:hypothetical protein n=1 Tax=Bradyrhizobium sp. TaxID=376 RepID=UPI002615F8FA|nr:hypothetical protein [Bradyrhizobium sp.]
MRAKAIEVTPERLAAYQVMMREARSRVKRPPKAAGPEALAAYFAQLDAARAKFFCLDHWPQGRHIKLMPKVPRKQMTPEQKAEIIAELERDYGFKFSSGAPDR